MKIYCNEYTLEERSPKTVYVSQYSSYKIGLKATKTGESKTVKLYDGASEISADATSFNGYTSFSLTSGTEGRKEYTVKADGADMKLIVVTTDSTVAELSSGSGGSSYELPIATRTTLGGVKVGKNLTVDQMTGVLSAKNGLETQYVDIDCQNQASLTANLTLSGDILHCISFSNVAQGSDIVVSVDFNNTMISNYGSKCALWLDIATIGSLINSMQVYIKQGNGDGYTFYKSIPSSTTVDSDGNLSRSFTSIKKLFDSSTAPAVYADFTYAGYTGYSGNYYYLFKVDAALPDASLT